MPQGMNVESQVGETVRHNVGGTADTRARDAQSAATTWAEGSRERGGGGVDRDGKWGCQAQAMRWLPYHRTPWHPFGNENPPPRYRLGKKKEKDRLPLSTTPRGVAFPTLGGVRGTCRTGPPHDV